MTEVGSAAVLAAALAAPALVAGCVLLGLALAGRRRDRALRRTGRTTVGTVVSTVTESRGYGFAFAPVVEFRTRDGAVVTVTGPRHPRRTFEVGSVLPVVYDPADPAGAVVGEPRTVRPGLLGAGLVLVVAGAAGLAAALVLRS